MFHQINKYFFLISFIFFAFCLFSQQPAKIQIINANSLEYDEFYSKNFKRLIGNVIFKHEEILMYCDSAYYYDEEDKFEAFSRIHIHQGDTLNIYADLLKYDGQKKIAELHSNVKLVDKETTVETNHLQYLLKERIAYYYDSGKIIDKENHLTSKIGYYFANRKEFQFRGNVLLINPDYTMYSDTLKYFTNTKTSVFLGHTTILLDSNQIYCESGWYNTETDISQYSRNTKLTTHQNILKCDSLFYDKNKGVGIAYKNVELIDTIQNIIIKSNYAEYNEKDEKTLVTDSVVLIVIFEDDSLFLHSDTLRSILSVNNPETVDSAPTKPYRILLAYPHVKFFSTDIQGKCDSLTYNFGDSTFRLFFEPVIWADKNQISAEYIEIHKSHNEIKSMDLFDKAFLISQEDSVRFNQIKGKTINIYFVENKIEKIFVKKNVEIIYYGKDEKNSYIGVNWADCDSLWIYFKLSETLEKDNEVHKIKFFTPSRATFYPIDELPLQELLLKDFSWVIQKRPNKKEDIFVWE